jgi:Protein of unknown function (DUF3108)
LADLWHASNLWCMGRIKLSGAVTVPVRALLTIFSVCLATASLAQSDNSQIRLRTEIFGLGGFHVATNRLTMETGPGRYAITLDVRSLGVASVIADVATHSEVSGAVISDALHPAAYRGEVHRNGTDIANWVNYAPDGSVTGGSSSREGSIRPLPLGPIQNTIDQLTAFYAMERKLARFDSCGLDLTVFDGRHLYKLHFSDGGPAVLQSSGKNGFSGATHICRFEREAIAGFTDNDGAAEGISNGKLWYARLLGGQMVFPVRMELSSEFGSLTGLLAELRAPGKVLSFGD